MIFPQHARRDVCREGGRGYSLLETLASIVIIGIGIALFMKMQAMTRREGHGSANMLLAGQLIEKHMENMRITIAQDTNGNWPPPSGVTVVEDGITLKRVVSGAVSPVDGGTLDRVRKVDIVTYWGPAPRTPLDTLRISTYVSKRF